MHRAHFSYALFGGLAVWFIWVIFLAAAYAVLEPVVVAYWAIGYLLAVNIVTFIYFAHDKSIAGGPFFRVPESLLLLFAFAGGSPAAGLAQSLLRHKTRKRTFRLAYFAIVFGHVAIGLYCYELGAKLPWSMEVPMPFAAWLRGL